MTNVTMKLTNFGDPRRSYEEVFLVDTSATDSMVPGNELEKIGIVKEGTAYEGAAGTVKEYPYGLARMPSGNLAVCEYGNNRIQVFTPQGQSVAVYGQAGRQAGELAYPWAVAVDSSGLAYVVDSGNNRIQIWQL